MTYIKCQTTKWQGVRIFSWQEYQGKHDLTFIIMFFKCYKTTSIFYKTTKRAAICLMPLDMSPNQSLWNRLCILHAEPHLPKDLHLNQWFLPFWGQGATHCNCGTPHRWCWPRGQSCCESQWWCREGSSSYSQSYLLTGLPTWIKKLADWGWVNSKLLCCCWCPKSAWTLAPALYFCTSVSGSVSLRPWWWDFDHWLQKSSPGQEWEWHCGPNRLISLYIIMY